MDILITGATGFLGSTLISKIFDENFFENINIYAFVLPKDKFQKNLSKWKNLKIIYGDITNFDEINNAICGKDIVINCAGLISYWKKDYNKLINVNVNGVKNIVESCIKNKVKKLIHISSVGAIGFHKDGRPAEEETPFNYPDCLYYMKSKYLGQLIVEKAIEEKKLNAVILCPASIMGPGDPDINTPHNQIYQKVYKNKMFGSFKGGLAVVDVRDIAQIIIKNIKNNFPEGKYLIVGKNLKYKEVLKTIEKYSKKKVYPFIISPIILSFVGFILEILSYITRRKSLLTFGYGLLSGWKTFYSNEKSCRIFKHSYIDFEKTIEDSCQYFEINFLNN
jgi:dihydroflavonol-4-reductase